MKRSGFKLLRERCCYLICFMLLSLTVNCFFSFFASLISKLLFPSPHSIYVLYERKKIINKHFICWTDENKVYGIYWLEVTLHTLTIILHKLFYLICQYCLLLISPSFLFLFAWSADAWISNETFIAERSEFRAQKSIWRLVVEWFHHIMVWYFLSNDPLYHYMAAWWLFVSSVTILDSSNRLICKYILFISNKHTLRIILQKCLKHYY